MNLTASRALETKEVCDVADTSRTIEGLRLYWLQAYGGPVNTMLPVELYIADGEAKKMCIYTV